jgi:hypothetical protein
MHPISPDPPAEAAIETCAPLQIPRSREDLTTNHQPVTWCHEGAGLPPLRRPRRYPIGRNLKSGTKEALMANCCWVGIDLHRSRSQVAVLDDEGGELLSRRISNDPRTLLELLAEIDGESKLVLEATYGWEWLADLLQDAIRAGDVRDRSSPFRGPPRRGGRGLALAPWRPGPRNRALARARGRWSGDAGRMRAHRRARSGSGAPLGAR